MLICSCTVISDHDIRTAVKWMRSADPLALITPGKVYRALGKKPDCGGCIDHFVAAIANEVTTGVPDLKQAPTHPAEREESDERQREGHRLPQPRAAL